MAFNGWDSDFFAECAARLTRVEAKLSNEQLEYLRQYYTINKFPRPNDLQTIAKQWNNDNFHFFLDLADWFFGQRMAEQEAEQRRCEARKAAA